MCRLCDDDRNARRSGRAPQDVLGSAQIGSPAVTPMLDARQSGPAGTRNMGRAAPDGGGILVGGPKFRRAEPTYR